ncbi:MAG: hypothetical protein JF610_02015 [Acidobacteria bacterium]|nr:hypothetical protein [Acidobacteriota bacterium]
MTTPALFAAQRQSLVAHRPGGERVDNRLRRPAAQRVHAGRARIVAGVAAAARAFEDRGAVRRRIDILPAGGGPGENATEHDRNDGEESPRTPNQNHEDIIGT